MNNLKCPYCKQTVPLVYSTYQEKKVLFDESAARADNDKSQLGIAFFKCPNCNEFTIAAKGLGEKVSDIDMRLRPLSSAVRFPDYIPEPVRKDYEEACAIVSLSPKASATLSRRCLQNMIRDFWGISRNSLYHEIEALDETIPLTQKQVLHSLRSIGNIGAHPGTDINTIIDIDPEDASKLIKVIEFFMEKWYIDRHAQEELFNEINSTSEELQAMRNPNEE